MKTIIFRILLAGLAIVVVAAWIDRYYLLPENGVEVMICGLHEESLYRITGDQSDYDTLSQGAPRECTVMVMTLDEQHTFEVVLDDEKFYSTLRIGEIVIGIQTGPGYIASLLKR